MVIKLKLFKTQNKTMTLVLCKFLLQPIRKQDQKMEVKPLKANKVKNQREEMTTAIKSQEDILETEKKNQRLLLTRMPILSL